MKIEEIIKEKENNLEMNFSNNEFSTENLESEKIEIQEKQEPQEIQELQERKKRKYNKTGKYSKKNKYIETEKTEEPEIILSENTIKVNEETPSSDDFFREYTKENETEKMQEDEKKFYNNYVSGYLFLICIDAVFPELLIQLFSFYDKKFKQINPKNLKLEQSEIKELEPLADEVVKELLGQMNPTSQFLLAIAFLYGGKLMVHRAAL